MKRITLILSLPIFISCQSLTEADPQLTTSPIYEDVSTYQFQDRSSPAWVSDAFSGTHSRQFQEDILTFSVEQTHREGGLDVGLSDIILAPAIVAQLPDDVRVCSAYDVSLSGEGRWWAGPKISVNWQGDESAKQNGDDWYENYVVEVASTSASELHDILTDDYFNPEILPDTIWAGSTYRNYKIRFHDWWQFWSVRQEYRSAGTLNIKPILQFWSGHGLPETRRFDGVKANIETYGPIKGSGRLAIDVTTSKTQTPQCPI